MKSNLVLSILAAMCLFSTAASASHWGEYSQEQMQLTNKLFKLCPAELTQLMSQPYTNITSGSFVGGMTPEGVSTSYFFTFEQRLPAPSFGVNKWVLNALELTKENPIQAPDAPGMITEVSCVVTAE